MPSKRTYWEDREPGNLLPHVAAGVGARHGDKGGGTVESDDCVSERSNVLRSRPGPQPKSRIVKGGGPSICLNSAAMFWLTSWSAYRHEILGATLVVGERPSGSSACEVPLKVLPDRICVFLIMPYPVGYQLVHS